MYGILKKRFKRQINKKILKLFFVHSWSYISVAYINSGMGAARFAAFRSAAPGSSVCLGSTIPINEGATDASIREQLAALDDGSGARVVLLLGETSEVGAWKLIRKINEAKYVECEV
jgi:hypothetical protein